MIIKIINNHKILIFFILLITSICLYYTFREIKYNYLLKNENELSLNSNNAIILLSEKLPSILIKKEYSIKDIFDDKNKFDEIINEFNENDRKKLEDYVKNSNDLSDKREILINLTDIFEYLYIITVILDITILLYIIYDYIIKFVRSENTTIIQRSGFILLILSISIFIFYIILVESIRRISSYPFIKMMPFISIVTFIIAILAMSKVIDKSIIWIKKGKKEY